MLLCQKAHVLCVPYSSCYMCDFHLWTRAGYGKGQPFVHHFLPSWPFSTKSWCCSIPWWAPTSSSERGRISGPMKRRMGTCSLSVLGCECSPARCQCLSVRFASLQPAPLCCAEPLAPVIFSLPYPLSSLCSQLSCLSLFFPCLSTFLFPLGLLFASPPSGFLSPLRASTSDSRNFKIWYCSYILY